MLDFLYIPVSWVLLRWHDLFTLIGFSDSSGWGWTLSILFLVVTARVLLVRLFIKQVHYTRNMQKMQPKMKKLKDKYKDDKPELNRQMMALQQEEGFNPLTGCLPMFLQIPVFIGLYHVLRHLANSAKPDTIRNKYSICEAVAKSAVDPSFTVSDKARSLLSLYTFSGGPTGETCHAASSTVLSAPLAASFRDSNQLISSLGGDPSSTRWVVIVLLLISAAGTFGTQLLVRMNATTVPEGNAALIQKFMLYVIPVGVLASGLLFNFPLGVLLYWFASNLWTLGQQAYIVRFHPPDEEEMVVVGQLGKTLAPKPGQRPVRMTKSGPGSGAIESRGDQRPPNEASGTKASAPEGSAPKGSAPKDSPPGSGARAVQRPGQRPARPAGKRPPAKRPTKAKKRR